MVISEVMSNANPVVIILSNSILILRSSKNNMQLILYFECKSLKKIQFSNKTSFKNKVLTNY